MSKPKNPLVINHVFLSGCVLSEPEVRRVGSHQYSILSVEAELVQRVGKGDRKRIETLRWIGTCFGKDADKVKGKLKKGMQILVQGQLSAYRRPKGRKPQIQEITVEKLSIVPEMDVVFEATIEESTAEQRRQELMEDLS